VHKEERIFRGDRRIRAVRGKSVLLKGSVSKRPGNAEEGGYEGGTGRHNFMRHVEHRGKPGKERSNTRTQQKCKGHPERGKTTGKKIASK